MSGVARTGSREGFATQGDSAEGWGAGAGTQTNEVKINNLGHVPFWFLGNNRLNDLHLSHDMNNNNSNNVRTQSKK